MMKVRNLCFFLAIALFASPMAMAFMPYLTAAEMTYPKIVGTALDSCALCHSSGTNRNSYGEDYGSHSHNFQNIENLDSDSDGATNKAEIDALTFPGDSNSVPPAASITVKKPGNGVTLTLGTKILVSWTSTGDVGTDVSIELWQNGQKVKTLKGTTPNDGKQKVVLKDTLPTGSGFSIKVISNSNAAISDFSPGTFTIVGP